MLGTNIETTFTQRCLNIILMSVLILGSDVATIFTQRCPNIVSTLAYIGQCCDNIVVLLGFQTKYNIGTTFTQCCLDFPKTLLGHLKVSTMNVATTMGMDVDTTFNQHCNNVATMLEHQLGYCDVKRQKVLMVTR